MKTRELVTDAMLAAMCAVLGYLAIDTGSIKITFESLPVLLGGFLFGPLDGAIIGGVGTLIYQLLRYGVSITTALWILPYVLAGLLCGAAAKRSGYGTDRGTVAVFTVLAELLITLCNTGTLWLDSRIFGYWFPGFIAGSLFVRLILCAVKGAAFAAVLPGLLRAVGRITGRKEDN